MERLRPRRASSASKFPPCERQRKWRAKFNSNPQEVSDTMNMLMSKIIKCIRILTDSHTNDKNYKIVKKQLRHLYSTLRDMIHSGIVDTEEIGGLVKGLDTLFHPCA